MTYQGYDDDVIVRRMPLWPPPFTPEQDGANRHTMQGLLDMILPLSHRVRWITTLVPPSYPAVEKELHGVQQLMRRIADEVVPVIRRERESASMTVAQWALHCSPATRQWLLAQGSIEAMTWDNVAEAADRTLWRRAWIDMYRDALLWRQERRAAPSGFGVYREPHHYVLVSTSRDHAAHVQSVLDRALQAGPAVPLAPLHDSRSLAWCKPPCAYREPLVFRPSSARLEPVHEGYPYLRVLDIATPLRGHWQHVIEMLLASDDILMDIDVWWMCYEFLPVPTPLAWYFAERNVIQTSIARPHSELERYRAEQLRDASRRVQQRLAAHERTVTVQFWMVIGAYTRAALDRGTERIRDRLLSSCAGVRVPPNRQRHLLAYLLDAPLAGRRVTNPSRSRHMMMTAHAVTCLPLHVGVWSTHTGIPWLETVYGSVWFRPMEHQRAGHMVILGKTGYGKTFAMHVWMLRLCVMTGARIVVYEPQGHAHRLAHAVGAGGRSYVVAATESYNILDVLVGRIDPDRPPPVADQIGMVIGLLGVVLGTSQTGEGTSTFQPRVWTPIEVGVLEQALAEVYRPWQDALDMIPDDAMPCLSDVAAALQTLADRWEQSPTSASPNPHAALAACARALATEIEIRLLHGPQAAIFNRRTTVPWTFVSDVMVYDMSQIVDQRLRALAYTLGLGALLRYLRRMPADQRRPLYVVIDEFGALAMTSPVLVTVVATLVKTGRTLGVAVVVIDQDPGTFDRTTGPYAEAYQSIWSNSTALVSFHLDPVQATRLIDMNHGVLTHDAHHAVLTRLPRGAALMVIRDRADAYVVVGHVHPTPQERTRFAGT